MKGDIETINEHKLSFISGWVSEVLPSPLNLRFVHSILTYCPHTSMGIVSKVLFATHQNESANWYTLALNNKILAQMSVRRTIRKIKHVQLPND